MFSKPGNPPTLPPPPPLSAQFQSKLEPSIPGAKPIEQTWSLFRSADGKTRTDHGDQSLITDPKAGNTIRLDHVKKEAHIFPADALPNSTLQAGGTPAFTPPKLPTNVKDLGTRMMGQHEVQGKSYTFQPPQVPKDLPKDLPKELPQDLAKDLPKAPVPPQLPKAPQAPAAPGIQGASLPGAPALPQAPKMQELEVWTSTKLHLPMATRSTGDLGKQVTMNKQLTVGEPPASMFQIPPGYKIVKPEHAPTSSS